MRLIHTESFQLKEFFDEAIPEYAILSHRWGEKEISYHTFIESSIFVKSNWKDKSGFAKIEAFCDLARRRGWQWAWVDTCCIDKTSSAELSEAINSMYRWYRASTECYVYLYDVTWDGRHLENSLFEFREGV